MDIDTPCDKIATMLDIILKAASYLIMIAVAYSFKRAGVLTKEHGKALSYICMKFTLPCALIANFSIATPSASLLWVILIGFAGTMSHLLFGFAFTRNKSREERVLYTSNTGFNIGNFTLPFISSFSGPMGIITTSLYDAGNGFSLLGINYPIIDAVVNKRRGKDLFVQMAKKLFSSVPFDVYCLMIFLSVLNLSLPGEIVLIASEIGKGNGPIAMIMIGLLLELHFDKRYLKSTSIFVASRVAIGLGICFVATQLSFLPWEAKKAVIIAAWSPIGSVGPAYTSYLGGDEELAGFVNTISILIALAVIPTLAIVL